MSKQKANTPHTKPKKQIYFMRHGLSEANKSSLWSGRLDTPLSPEGHEHAKEAGRIAREQGLVFDVVLSSPLQRAHHTAQHVATALNYDHDKILLNDLLVERDFGELEGLYSMDISEQYRADESIIDTYKNAEKLVDMQARAHHIIEHLHALPHDRILVVAHGAFGRALRRAINNAPLSERGASMNNAEIIRLL